ncbi:retropepsin-like aspartic protease [Marinimicrobium sp. UBA4209]|jgi:clan AA aspartic protease (TIGR02281 family)|uniref:retropepsin-like aspartic protease n=2 Tax=Cellvibrionaceae TaxID=1706371 RepID=UPI00257AB74B|nr:retropepsin-like aspartic protease [Marinimicrobium sp. UBA4209]
MSTQPPFRPLLLASLLLATGLAGGWWLRGALAPVPVEATSLAEPSKSASGSPLVRPLSSPPVRDSSVTSPSLNTLEAATLPDDPVSANEAPPQPADWAEEMHALLDQQAFNAAMGLYQEAERQDSALAGRLRELVLEYLEDYLRAGDDYALTALADAFLSVHYDDIDVLLLLARHQLQSDYWAEAARTFQLTFAYSATQPGQRSRVSQAFEQFVRQVDDQLVGAQRWQSLLGFYETLEQLDLGGAEQRLRLGELHLHHGDTTYGRSLLEALTSHSTLGARATALLNHTTPPPVAERRPPPPVGSIELDTIGSHYLLPLGLDSREEVRLVIDTGASLTTLTQRSFDRISASVRFTELGPQMFNTASGTTRGMVYRVDSVQIGDHRLRDVPVAVLDFNTPDNVDGLLGMNVLSQFRFEVDQDDEVLLLQPRQ